MKSVIILEPDDNHFGPLKKAVHSIQSDLNIIRFTDIKAVLEWMKALVKGEDEELKKIKVQLFIFDLEKIGRVNIELLKKTQTMFIQQQLTDPNKPAGFLLTTHNNDYQYLKQFIHPVVMNVVIKPFDELTLKEFIHISLKGRTAISTEMYEADVNATVEIVKEIPIIRITELGFRTENKRPIELGKKAKYYSPFFGEKNILGLYAYCYETAEIEPGKHQCSFSYFGLNSDQFGSLRREIKNYSGAKQSVPLKDADRGDLNDKKVMFVLTSNEEHLAILRVNINERFENIAIEKLESLEKEPGDIKGAKIAGVIVGPDAPSEISVSAVRDFVIKNYPNAEPRILKLSESPLSGYEDLEKFKDFDDYVTLPIDRFYFSRTLKQAFPSWKTKDKAGLSRECIDIDTTIDTGLPISIKKISETNLNLNYTRPLSVGDIRKFILTSIDGKELMEMYGYCHYSEELSKQEFKNYFVFFGVNDNQLRFIRKWLLQNYAKAKAAAKASGGD